MGFDEWRTPTSWSALGTEGGEDVTPKADDAKSNLFLDHLLLLTFSALVGPSVSVLQQVSSLSLESQLGGCPTPRGDHLLTFSTSVSVLQQVSSLSLLSQLGGNPTPRGVCSTFRGGTPWAGG